MRPRKHTTGRPCRWLARRCPRRTALMAVVVLLAVVALSAVGLARLRTDTSPQSFLPAGDETLRAMQDVASSFGGDPLVVLLESDQPRQLFAPEQLPGLLRLEGQLAQLPDVATVYGPATTLNQIAISAQNLLATISGRRDAVRIEAQQVARAQGASPEEAKAAGQAAVAEFDHRYATLLVRGLPAGLPTLRNPGFINEVLFENGRTQAQWQFVVPAPNAVAILVRPREGLEQAGTERLVEAVRATVERSGLNAKSVTITGAPAVAAALGEQVRQEIFLLGGLAIGLIALCYLLVPWHRSKRHRLLPLTATLCSTALVLAGFGWLNRPVSLGVIAFLPILIGIGSDFPAYLVQRTHRRRVLVAAVASAVGFASLAVSPLPFVRELGLALAAGVLLAVAVALVFRRYLVREHPEPPQAAASTRPPVQGAILATSQRAGLLVLAGAIASAGWVALPRLDIEARPDRLAAGLAAVETVERAEQVLGSSGEIRVVLSGPDVLTPEVLSWMRQAQESVVLAQGGDVTPIVSLPDLLAFLGPSPTQSQISSAMELLPAYLTGAVVRADQRRAVLSFGLELQDLDQQQRLLEGVRAALPPPPRGFAVDVVGLPVAAVRAYTLVSGDRYLTNLLGIAAAGLVLLIGLSRRFDALRAVLAATLATGWGLAGAWVLGISLSPLTIALGSLTTATACEFTVLLADRYRRSWPRLGRTVAAAALAAGLGYASLAASQLAVIREFGLLLATTVGLSFLAAHVVIRLLPGRRAVSTSNRPKAVQPEPTRTEVPL